MRVSVILPTFNEEKRIGQLISYLYRHADQRLQEIIVADGQSCDLSCEEATQAGARVLHCAHRGRAAQMNAGAQAARGDVLYFVHADTLPPTTYLSDIDQALEEGCLLGGYRSAFDSNRNVFKVNAWFTKSSKSFSHGGDQTLFVDRELFDKLGGYDERYVIMEDYDFVRRARRVASFKKMPKDALISVRKYEHNSYLRVTLANLLVFSMYQLGVMPSVLQQTYRKLLKDRPS